MPMFGLVVLKCHVIYSYMICFPCSLAYTTYLLLAPLSTKPNPFLPRSTNTILGEPTGVVCVWCLHWKEKRYNSHD